MAALPSLTCRTSDTARTGLSWGYQSGQVAEPAVPLQKTVPSFCHYIPHFDKPTKHSSIIPPVYSLKSLTVQFIRELKLLKTKHIPA